MFEVNRKLLPAVKSVGMVAGGTGITPMLQVQRFLGIWFVVHGVRIAGYNKQQLTNNTYQ